MRNIDLWLQAWTCPIDLINKHRARSYRGSCMGSSAFTQPSAEETRIRLNVHPSVLWYIRADVTATQDEPWHSSKMLMH